MKKFAFSIRMMAAMILLGIIVTAFSAGNVMAEKMDLNEAEASPEWVAALKEAADAEQIFVVAGIGQTTAYVSMHEKDSTGTWKQIMTTPGYIGKYGLGKTKEGDAKTPVGTFRFNYAFGIAEDPGCTLPYQQVTEDDYWSGDQAEGHQYNQMVSIQDIPDLNTEDSEHLIDYTVHYQYCLNISYNEECIPGLGSAIFLHCLGPQKPYTGGCVAIPKEQMITVMQNVREDCVVVIGSLDELAPALWEEWELSPADADDTDGKQTVTAYLQQTDDIRFAVEADLTGGWTADFASGAVYLYDGENYEGREPVAMGLSLEQEVYDEYIAGADAYEDVKKTENGVSYKDESGRICYFQTVGDNGCFMLSVEPGNDAEEIYSRISVRPEM